MTTHRTGSFTIIIAVFCALLLPSAARADADEAYKIGLEAFKAGKFPAAETALLNAVKDVRTAKKSRQLLAFVYMNQNRLGDAEKVLGELGMGDEPATLQDWAWFHFYKGNYDQAAEFFKKELAWADGHKSKRFTYKRDDQFYIESMLSDANFGLALVAERQGRADEAIARLKDIEDYKNQFVGRKKVFTKLGDLLYVKKSFEDALAAYRRAITINADEAEGKDLAAEVALAQLKAGWASYELKKFDDAAKFFEQAGANAKLAADARYGLTMARIASGKADAAAQDLAKFVEATPYAAEIPAVYALIDKNPQLRNLWKPWGLAYYKLGDYASALYKLAGYIEQVSRTDYESMVAAGWCNQFLGSYDLAAATFKAAAELNAQADEPLVGQGSVALALAQYPKAKGFFEQAIARNPDSAMAYNGMGFLHLALRERPQALASFRKAVGLKPDDYSSQAAIADMLLADKKYAEAATEYEVLGRLSPKAAPPVYGLAWAKFYQDQLDEAAALFRKAEGINPYLAPAYYGQGLVAAKKGDDALARKCFATAIAIAPGYSASPELLDLVKKNGWNDLLAAFAWGFYYQRAYLPAVPYFEQALAKAPDRTLTAGLAWSSLWLGQRDKADKLFQGLLAADANDAEGLLGAAAIAAQKGDLSAAKATLDKLLAAKPADLGALRLLASVQQRQDDLAGAKDTNAKIAKLLPQAPDTYNQEGWALYAERRYPEAAEKFKASLMLSGYFASPHYGLGLALLRQGDLARAKAELLTGVSLDPDFMDNPEVAKAAGEEGLKELATARAWSYYYRFNGAKAKELFQQVLAKEPANRDALQGLGTVAYMTGDYAGASAALARLVPGMPKTAGAWDNNSYILDNLGWSQYYTKAYDQALATFKRLEAYHPEVGYIAPINGQAWSMLRKGNKKGAAALFKKSLAIVPDNPVAKNGLAEAGGK